MTKPRILFWDIESLPIIKRDWSLYPSFGNYKEVIHDWSIICISYKWAGENKTYRVSVTDNKRKLDRTTVRDDSSLLRAFVPVLEEADWAVAHNGDKFDVKKLRARLVINGLSPNAPFKQYDTLKVAKREFGFTSNRLDDLGVMLGVGRKIKTDYDLWIGCENADLAALHKMGMYCNGDVRLLERVYNKIKVFDTQHPNMNVIQDTALCCQTCGSSKVQKRGYRLNTRVGDRFQRFKCMACGSWGSRPAPKPMGKETRLR